MVDLDDLCRTRESLHAVAEWVLAPARQRVDGRIGLRALPGGFGSPEAGLRIDGTALVAGTAAHPLTTLADAAAVAGVEAGRHPGVYEPATAWAPDAPLAVDEGAARLLADWFALGAEVLEELRWQRQDASATTLWPEHFDLALTAGEVNLGFSPGDADHPRPYAYVGPWVVPTGPFWNEPFGASLDHGDIDSPATALEFLRAGLAQLGAKPA